MGRYDYSNNGSREKYRIIPRCCYRRKFYDRLNGFLQNPPVTALIPATAVSEYPRCVWLQDALRFQNYWMVKSLCKRAQWWGFPGGSDGKESACNAGDLGLIPQMGKILGEGNSYPLQCSCLQNPMDGGAWRATVHEVANNQTQLSDFTFFLSFWRRKWQPTLRFLPGHPLGKIVCQAI